MSTGLYQRGGKRAFDVIAGVVLLVICLPVMVAVGLLLRIRLGSPVLFQQRRPGLHGRPFTMLKFRTMTDARGLDGTLLPDVERMTAVGRLLRRTSLDELPELFNVISGDMSLVGPRPLLMEYLGRYSREQNRRHLVRPGITGLAQVAGRNHLSWDQKFRLDVRYVDTCSLLLDLKILVGTFLTVLTGRGVAQEGFATAEKFTGSNS